MLEVPTHSKVPPPLAAVFWVLNQIAHPAQNFAGVGEEGCELYIAKEDVSMRHSDSLAILLIYFFRNEAFQQKSVHHASERVASPSKTKKRGRSAVSSNSTTVPELFSSTRPHPLIKQACMIRNN